MKKNLPKPVSISPCGPINYDKRHACCAWLGMKMDEYKISLDKFEAGLYGVDKDTGKKFTSFRNAILYYGEAVMCNELMYYKLRGLQDLCDRGGVDDASFLSQVKTLRDDRLRDIICHDSYRHNSTSAMSNLENMASFTAMQEFTQILTRILISFGVEDFDRRLCSGWNSGPDF